MNTLRIPVATEAEADALLARTKARNEARLREHFGGALPSAPTEDDVRGAVRALGLTETFVRRALAEGALGLL